MKRFFLFCISTFALQTMYGQSYTLKYGKLEPLNKKAITILPNTKTEPSLILNSQSTSKDVVLVGGSMNPSLGGNEILNKVNTSKLPFNNNGNKGNGVSQLNTGLIPLAEYNIPVTTSTNSNNLGSLVDNNNFSLTNKPVSNSNNYTLEPLTYLPPKAEQTPKETIDPSRIKQPSSNSDKPVYLSSSNSKNTIPARTISTTSAFRMPELAPIEGAVEVKKNTSTSNLSNGMPELAPIDGIEVKKRPQEIMPELAPLEQENIQQSNDNTIRGFTVPKGTLLQAKDNKSFILKPSVPVKKESNQDIIFSKPSAGGGLGFIENTQSIEFKNEESTELNSLKQQTSREQLLQAAKNHQHDPNNPCCRVQMNSATKKRVATKKRTTKKPFYTKKKASPKTVVYAYKQDPIQTKNTERIVYVPLQSEQEQIKQPKQQVYTPKEEPSQNKEKVVYRDYTNVYSKESPLYQTPCNCPQSNQQATIAKDAKSYYNPNNYAAGLNSGPTSGDYPIATSASNADMKYTFYVNPRGKYGVSIYNNNFSVLLSQNGKVMEYKAYGEGSNTGNPKLNYFGSPESIAGIPIEYNYNRTVHKIGNIKFDYDFEGFFKTVGNSMVFYNSRSSLSKVDNINVKYDASGNVTSVDSNNGVIQYNP